MYFDLYKETALGIKAADPLVLVGGPATAMLAWIPEFTAWCAANGAPIDFVSSHLYPTDPQLAVGRDLFMDSISNATLQAAAAGLPFLLTEFNAGLGGPADAHGYSMLDSSYTAAFLLHQHLLAQGVPNLKSMSFWTFIDFGFEEQGVDPTPWAPGTTKFGVMNNEGVPKPAYRGLQMISQAAGDATLPVAGPGVRVYAGGAGGTVGTVDASATVSLGVVTVLLNNFNVSGAALPAAVDVTLTFTGLATPLPTGATLELIDEAHANPMAAWSAAGSPTYSPPWVIYAEMAASQVVPTSVPLVPSGDGAMAVTVTLTPYAMARLRLSIV